MLREQHFFGPLRGNAERRGDNMSKKYLYLKKAQKRQTKNEPVPEKKRDAFGRFTKKK